MYTETRGSAHNSVIARLFSIPGILYVITGLALSSFRFAVIEKIAMKSP